VWLINMNQVKAVIMGEGGVGKSTLVSLLQGEGCKRKHEPTIGVNVEKVYIGKNQVAVWDFAGQKRFQFMWDDFIKGAGLTVLVTDSSKKNVMETKELIKKFNNKLGSDIIAIANKQDLAGRLTPEEIENILGVPTFGMVAVNQNNEKALRSILECKIC